MTRVFVLAAAGSAAPLRQQAGQADLDRDLLACARFARELVGSYWSGLEIHVAGRQLGRTLAERRYVQECLRAEGWSVAGTGSVEGAAAVRSGDTPPEAHGVSSEEASSEEGRRRCGETVAHLEAQGHPGLAESLRRACGIP